MKRVIIVSILLPCMFAVSIRSMYLFNRVEDSLLRMTRNILEASDGEHGEKLLAEVEALCDYWEEEEPRLGHYIRHSQMDALGQSIARLPSLARHGDKSDLQVEVHEIVWHLENIKRTEAFSFSNILRMSLRRI